jgi:hypothetical protein
LAHRDAGGGAVHSIKTGHRGSASIFSSIASSTILDGDWGKLFGASG